MENRGSSQLGLKHRLSRVFRPSILLGSSCSSSTAAATTGTLSSATGSSRSLSSDVAHEPVFIRRSLSASYLDDRRHRQLPARRSVEQQQGTLNLKIASSDGRFEAQSKPKIPTFSTNNTRIMTKKKPSSSNPYGFTSSSDREFLLPKMASFGSEIKEQSYPKIPTFSSRSFPFDSCCEFYASSKKKKTPKNRSRRRLQRRSSVEGSAMVKQSSDPYGDFRFSMAEMIVERRLFAAEDLERLLRSFLSLNSDRHHNVILEVFSDILEVLFCDEFGF